MERRTTQQASRGRTWRRVLLAGLCLAGLGWAARALTAPAPAPRERGEHPHEPARTSDAPQRGPSRLLGGRDLDAAASRRLSVARLQNHVDAVGLGAYQLGPVPGDTTGALRGFRIPAAKAYDAWLRLREVVERSQRWPLVIDAPGVTLVEGRDPDGPTPLEWIERANGIDLAAWHEAKRREWREVLEYPEDRPIIEPGVWPEPQPAYEPSAWWFEPREPAKDGSPRLVWLALVPTTSPWDAIPWVADGGWNEFPRASVHVVQLAKWHRSFRLEIVAVHHDSLEFRILRPPATREEATAFARELSMYCPDAVEELLPSAARLLNARRLSLWWD